VTMGFIALIAGYVYRFRWYAQVAVVAGAVLLGYVFNFARLCILVLYYIVALHLPWLRSRAEMGDYIIGACLFLLGTFLLFYVVRCLSQSPGQIQAPAVDSMLRGEPVPGSFYPRLWAMTLLVVLCCAGVARAYVRQHGSAYEAQYQADEKAQGQFPDRIGSYKLSRSWNESLTTGPLIYHWAEYVPDGGGPHISVGVSPVLGSHDTLVCHSARGEDPLWRDQITFATAGNAAVSFSGSFFNDGATQYLEASTICNGGSCGEYTSDRARFGFVYSKPNAQSLFAQDPQRPIPILVKAETIDTTLPLEVARQQMLDAVRAFMLSADLNSLTQPYRH